MDLTDRPRRLRNSATLRDISAETQLDSRKLIMGYFVCEGSSLRKAIVSMPGIYRVSLDNLILDIGQDISYGLKSVLLFGIPDQKDETGTGAYDENGIVQQAARALKKEFPELLVITDVCLCEFTSHGHCGIVDNGKVLNDPTLSLLAKTAVSQAAAGADMVAPSDMMDGRVGAIRQALDEGVLCDMAEGAAPYKPRYVLPDYSVILFQSSAYLELDPPQDLDEATDSEQLGRERGGVLSPASLLARARAVPPAWSRSRLQPKSELTPALKPESKSAANLWDDAIWEAER